MFSGLAFAGRLIAFTCISRDGLKAVFSHFLWARATRGEFRRALLAHGFDLHGSGQQHPLLLHCKSKALSFTVLRDEEILATFASAILVYEGPGGLFKLGFSRSPENPLD